MTPVGTESHRNPGGLTRVVDYRFDSGELQDLIGATLTRAGWSTAFNAEQKGALWMAGIAGVGVVVTLVVLFVL